jgi:cytochrome c biogenesis protein
VFRYIEEITAANPGLLMKVPLFNPGLFKPYIFSLTRLEAQYFTGLHVVRDPGIPFVATGATLLLVGLLIIFLLPCQRVWVRMAQTETKILISIAGGRNRNQATFDSRIARLITHIQENLSR